MYWCARCSISGSITGGRSISDQKNFDGLSPIKNVWMTRDGWRSRIPWTYEVNHPINWERDSSLPSTNPMREAVVGLGRALVRKFDSNSFTDRSNEDIEAGLRQQYQVLAGPLRVWTWRTCSLNESVVSDDRVSKSGLVEPDHKSGFATELVPQSGRLRGLPRPDAVSAPPRVGSPGSGPRGTPFAGTPPGEPTTELPTCLDLVREAEKSLSRDNEWGGVGRRGGAWLDGGSPWVRLGRSIAKVVELGSGGRYEASVPEVLTVPVAYHAIVLLHSLRGPCGEAHDVLPAIGERRSCPPYAC
ncbi:hypothetical protein BHM03_00012962 [Ensete ventricosum]|nr:hypothetical protein BHM03_00012962 [Ensete ventricosum]